MRLNRFSRERGAYLTIMAIMIVVLLVFGSLILDVGRILALRAEMQNAIDSAALAAANELDGKADAQTRAKNAARNALKLNSHFARETGLLGEGVGTTTLPDDAFTFYCIIGSKFDPEPTAEVLDRFCGNEDAAELEPDKYAAAGPTNTHYVRVSMLPDLVDDHFTVDLIFFPLLSLLGLEDVIEELALSATAVAGRGFFACNFPPMAICDPFEEDGDFFQDRMPIGGSLQFKLDPGNQWTPGNVGFLESSKFKGNKKFDFYADEGDLGCAPPVLTSKTGNPGPAKSAFNTRFGIYAKPDDVYDDQYGSVTPPGAGASDEYPAAPNVVRYPKDELFIDSDEQFGTGEWNCASYWLNTHTGSPPLGCVDVGAIETLTQSRWDIYNREIDSAGLPREPPSGTGDEYFDGESSPASQERNRRRFFVAVLSCDALGLTGGKEKEIKVLNPDGFAEIFMIAPATHANDIDAGDDHPMNQGWEKHSMYGEYIGWGSENDEQFHIDVVLFE